MNATTIFAPHLQTKNVLAGMEYYTKAFGALELRHICSRSDARIKSPVAEGGIYLMPCTTTIMATGKAS